tara:strand:- start:5524 stop:5850 length:327 start_codon:yes stop_codon:yes gene_type:complete
VRLELLGFPLRARSSELSSESQPLTRRRYRDLFGIFLLSTTDHQVTIMQLSVFIVFVSLLSVIAWFGERREKQRPSPSPSRKLSEEEEMSIIWMLAKESPLESTNGGE